MSESGTVCELCGNVGVIWDNGAPYCEYCCNLIFEEWQRKYKEQMEWYLENKKKVEKEYAEKVFRRDE